MVGRTVNKNVGGDTTYVANAIQCDGTTNFFKRGGDLNGSNASKLFIYSAWILPDSLASNIVLYQNTAQHVDVQIGSTGDIRLFGFNNAGGLVYRATTALGTIVTGIWQHILISADMADEGASFIYVNDADVTPVYTNFVNDTLDFDQAEHYIGAKITTDGNKLTGSMADVYINNEHLDFSVEANRRKFISAEFEGVPVDLGITGSTPTGNEPLIFCSGHQQRWHGNKGNGGKFQKQGNVFGADTGPVTPAAPIFSSGSQFVYNSAATTNRMNTVTLDSSTVLELYNDGGPNSGIAQVLDISGTSITGNSEFEFSSVFTEAISGVAIDATKVIVAYGDSSNFSAQILDISSGTVTGNTPFVFKASPAGGIYTGLSLISPTKAIVAYTENNQTYAQILDISGGTITGNTELNVNGGLYSNVEVIDSARALFVYRDGVSGDGQATILDISGGTITGGNAVASYEPALINSEIEMAFMDSSTVLLTWERAGGKAVVIDISGSTASSNSDFTWYSDPSFGDRRIRMDKIDSTRALVMFGDELSSDDGTGRILTIDSGVVTTSDPLVYTSSTIGDVGLTSLDGTKFVVTYGNADSSTEGTAQVITVN